MTKSILTPVFALIVWTQVMLVWLYCRRIPALYASKLEGKLKAEKLSMMTKDEFNRFIPLTARWVADNYNHLTEHPTIFYALAFFIHHASDAQPSEVLVMLAWTYVALRVVHSFVQCVGNVMAIRLVVFLTSAIVLVAMTVLTGIAYIKV